MRPVERLVESAAQLFISSAREVVKPLAKNNRSHDTLICMAADVGHKRDRVPPRRLASRAAGVPQKADIRAAKNPRRG